LLFIPKILSKLAIDMPYPDNNLSFVVTNYNKRK